MKKRFSLILSILFGITLIVPVLLADMPAGGGSGDMPSNNLFDKVSDTAIGTSPAGLDFDLAGANILSGGVFYLNERAEADTTITAKGQIWVDTATPNTLMFTDDADTDFKLNVPGGTAPADATYITQTADSDLSAEQALGALSSGIMRSAATTGIITSLTDSAGIAANVDDETGTGVMVFSTAPAFTTSIDMSAGDILQADSIYGSTSILPVRIGDAATTTHSLDSEDDLHGTGESEFDGEVFLDGGTTTAARILSLDNVRTNWGTGTDTAILYSAIQTPNALMIGTSVDSENIIISQIADLATDFGHAQSTDSTIFMHGNDATDVNDFLSVKYDSTDTQAELDTGQGNIVFLASPEAGQYTFTAADDATFLTAMDLDCSATMATGEQCSYIFKVDEDSYIKLYSESDGSDETQNEEIRFLQDTMSIGSSPYHGLKNNTAEDGDGGRESTVAFKGLQSGYEETTLAKILAQHDGAADDQKGDLRFFTNDGTDGDSPTEALKIDSLQDSYFAGDITSVDATFSGRVQYKQGADVASATNLTLGAGGNVFEITGTTKIDLIDNTGWQNGSEIILLCNENVIFDDGTATSGSNITLVLAGGGDFNCTADDVLIFRLGETTASGVAWREQTRSAN